MPDIPGKNPGTGGPDLSAGQQALLQKLLKKKLSDAAPADIIPRRPIFSPVPLSFSQQRLWVLDRLVPGNPFYNLPTAVQLPGQVEVTVLARAVNEIIRRHEALRTVFTMENGEPVQVIRPELEIAVEKIDLAHLPPEDQEQETRRLMAQEATAPFDLEQGPLLRLKCLEIGPDNYVLLYTLHHIVSDTWSMNIFNRELALIYDACLSGRPAPLKELSLQYADFSLWQRQRLSGEVMEKQLAFWRQMLSGELPILELPADRQRPPVPSYRGHIQYLAIPATVTQGLAGIARQEQCSLFMVLLAAFNVLLFRYTGQEDILVGSPIAGRNRVELEQMIGFFANTLVFRTDLSENPPFRALVSRVRQAIAGAYDNQDVPFEKLVEEFQPDRYMSHTPLFQVMFVMQNVPPAGAATGAPAAAEPDRVQTREEAGTGVRHLAIHSGTAKFDLWLSLSEGKNGLGGVLEYNTDIFTDPTVTRIIGHFQELLAAIAGHPDQAIADLAMLSEREKEQILSGWNDTARPYDLASLPQAFRAQVDRTPDATALIGPAQRDVPVGPDAGPEAEYHLTYRELHRQANRVAHYLRQLGVRANTPVGVCLERSIDLVIALYGILEAAGAYLPLDPEYPGERISFMIADAGLDILITARTLADELPVLNQPSKTIFREEFAGLGPEVRAEPVCPLSLDDAAYIIYTSGSTGRPKGAIIPHRGIANRLCWMQEAFCLTATDRVLQKTPFSFDVSVWEFFWPLLTGAVLVMARPGGHRDTAYLVEVIRQKGITTIHFVPTLLNTFLDEPDSLLITSLKRVICSGEALVMGYRERFFGRLSAQLINLYGPTEASVDVTAWDCGRQGSYDFIPIGYPVANTRMYILDRYQNPVPQGVHGEIYIGGVQVGRGYLNRPELTAERFSRTPAAPLPSVGEGLGVWAPRLYRTGDLGRWLPDGAIDFIGRLDFQVKVRGFRIELGEIEARLREHPGVREAVVLAREEADDARTKKLVGYLVTDTDYWQGADTGPARGLPADQVKDWQNVFDDTYTRDPGQADPTFNIIGWNSSYTHAPIPAEEMRLWVDHTVDRLLALKPQRVLEIGCGTGLFLFRLVPHCRYYLGTDISSQGLHYIRQNLEKLKQSAPDTISAQVELKACSADDLSSLPREEVDLVIINSVVQYFPSIDYLDGVIREAVKWIKPGGYLFLGDVRHLSLLKTFQASVEFFQAKDTDTRDQVWRRLSNRLYLEQELVIDPHFFTLLTAEVPEISGAALLLKHGRYENELSKFRGDVILKRSGSQEPPITVVDYPGPVDREGLAEIGRLLAREKPEALRLTDIPNGRLAEDMDIYRWLSSGQAPDLVADIRQKLAESRERVIDPEDFRDLGKDLPYQAFLTLSRAGMKGDTFDVVYVRQDRAAAAFSALCAAPGEKPGPVQPRQLYANNPLLIKISRRLIPELRDFLKERLPEYMVPSLFVLLERLPMTPNGKLDRQNLLLYEPLRSALDQTGEYAAPATDTEKLLAGIWQEVLFLEKVGVNDNFFGLGGDSINAIQVISRVNQQGFTLSVRNLYQNMTINELAHYIDRFGATGLPANELLSGQPLLPMDRAEILSRLPKDTQAEDIYPITPLQKHMLFYYLSSAGAKEPGLFVNQVIFRMPLQPEAVPLIKKAFQELTDAYPYLRTAFLWEKIAGPVQVVHREVTAQFTVYDWRKIPAAKQEKKVRDFIQDDHEQGFERDKPQVYRISVILLAGGQGVLVKTSDLMRVDGWSAMIVINKFFRYVASLLTGQEMVLEADPTYKQYLSWLSRQDDARGEDYWRPIVQGCRVPTPLVSRLPGNVPARDRGFSTQPTYFSRAKTVEIEGFLKKQQLVLSALVSSLWGLLLAHYTGEERVIFGILFSGRSSALPGVETMIGQALNVLPMRADIAWDKPLLEWLRDTWHNLVELNQYECNQQDKIRSWWDIPAGIPLFESYLVVENFPGIKENMQRALRSSGAGDRLESRGPGFDYIAQMEYPLRVEFQPGLFLGLTMQYYRRSFSDAAVSRMIGDLTRLIEEVPKDPRRTLRQLLSSLKAS